MTRFACWRSRLAKLARACSLLALAGCCFDHDEVSCVPWEDAAASCPTREQALELLSVDEVVSDGVYWPERRLIIEGEELVDPPSCCYDTVTERCVRQL